MSMHDLATSILAQAKSEAMRIDHETARKVEEIAEETRTMVRERRQVAAREARKLQEAERAREEARMKRAIQLEELACRRALLEEAFSLADTELERRTGKAREALLAGLFERAKKELGSPAIEAAAQDRSFLAKRCKIKGTFKGKGGFIAHSADGAVRMDFRFEALLDEIRQQKPDEIAKVLFP